MELQHGTNAAGKMVPIMSSESSGVFLWGKFLRKQLDRCFQKKNAGLKQVT